MVTLSELIGAMERIAPPEYAEAWDNVGLLIAPPPSPSDGLNGPILLTIDLTEPVVAEGERIGAAAVVSYHPPIFEPLKRITGATGRERVVLRAVRAGMAVYSPHTALDAAEGGVTDWLADGLMDRTGVVKADRRALRPHAGVRASEEVKIVTFVPAASVETLRASLASAGAGFIGGYELCSFSSPGKGTFLGAAGTAPVIGEAGRLEEVEELRLEMVCSKRALPLAMETLRQFHPYEQPAVDVYELMGRPRRAVGAGRRLVLDQPATLAKLADRLKTHLGVRAVWIGSARGEDPVTYVGVCPGAGASLAQEALADGCEVFVTGEMKHHEVLGMMEAGMSVILAGHTTTERGYLARLAERLTDMLPAGRFVVSKADQSPLAIG